MDLSAAFDLNRPGIFVKKAKDILRDGLLHLVKDFITDRKAYVELGENVSTTFKFMAGCPKGSTLGPKVFNIYYRVLRDIKPDGTIVTYADDSYVIVRASTMPELKNRIETVMSGYLRWLQENGMVCNVEKQS
jgi:hypothetical protein